MSENIHKSHNVSRLMYHFVFPTKYRRVVIDEEVDKVIKETCIEISKRYEVEFLEIGTDKDHVHFLVQSVPNYSPTRIVRNCHEIKCIILGLVLYSSMIRLARLFQYQFYSSYHHLLLTRSGIYLYLQRI